MDECPDPLPPTKAMTGHCPTDQEISVGGDGDRDEVVPGGENHPEEQGDGAELVGAGPKNPPGRYVEGVYTHVDHIYDTITYYHGIDASCLLSSDNDRRNRINDDCHNENSEKCPRIVRLLVYSHCCFGVKFQTPFDIEADFQNRG